MHDQQPLPYTAGRHTDPRIAERVHAALGDSHSILHVSGGNGTYEPEGRAVVVAESDALRPFEDDSFDAAMACLTVERWQDPLAVLREMRRVTTGPVVILAQDLPHLAAWQRDYFAPLIEIDRERMPTPAEMAPALGRRTRIDMIRTPIDCQDGFIDSFWARPEALLDPEVRAALSVWSLAGPEIEAELVARLRADIESGTWYEAHGHLRSHPDYDGALRLIVSDPLNLGDAPRRI